MNLELNAESATITPGYNKVITVSIDDVSKGDVLSHFEIKDILAHFEVSELLEEIGADQAKEHWDLIDKPNE